ncbi:MAG: hypothetical protein HC854_16715 [Flavobacterium sp.]|nr:hypothetical protein [Flavobacterium sp.]
MSFTKSLNFSSSIFPSYQPLFEKCKSNVLGEGCPTSGGQTLNDFDLLVFTDNVVLFSR